MFLYSQQCTKHQLMPLSTMVLLNSLAQQSFLKLANYMLHSKCTTQSASVWLQTKHLQAPDIILNSFATYDKKTSYEISLLVKPM